MLVRLNRCRVDAIATRPLHRLLASVSIVIVAISTATTTITITNDHYDYDHYHYLTATTTTTITATATTTTTIVMSQHNYDGQAPRSVAAASRRARLPLRTYIRRQPPPP